MSRPLAAIVKQRHLLWKQEWELCLRAEPVLTALAEPAILVRLMDDTMAQFRSLLWSRPDHRWMVDHAAGFGPQDSGCRCGLNPLLAYFSTGQIALERVLCPPVVSESQYAELRLCWHFLAQREIQSLCGACGRVCAPAFAAGSEVAPGGLESER